MSARPHAVVTGGAGFLGSHLVDALLDDGYQVTTLDNYSSATRANLAHLDDNERITIREHDVCDPFPAFESVDRIYHLASRASPADFDSHPVEIALANSEGAHNAFECAREHDTPVVIASTSEVYGDPEVHPQHEAYNGNVNPRGPRAPYDEGKRFMEALATAYGRQHDLDVRTARIFNTYGPRMRPDDGRVVPNFLMQALRGEEHTVYGDGTQTRSFCYVSDLIRGLRALGDASPETVSGEAVNLGNTREITINTFAEAVVDVLDTDSTVGHYDRPQDDPDLRRPDTTRARRLLDWEPEVPLATGVERTAAYFRETIDER
jgi:UDP-glucuronate decarboxylase